MEELALAYQQSGCHAEALELFGRLIGELPAVAQHKAFRKAVKVSESALHRNTTMLPKAKFSLRRLFTPAARVTPISARQVSPRAVLIIAGSAVALAVIALALANENIRRHRKLYVVNAVGPGLQVEISGVGPVRLVADGPTEVTLPEGHYEARITGPISETVPFDIQAGYFSRWTDRPAWVLNPGGAAILVLERAVYSKNPEPGTFTYYFGRKFQAFAGIDNAFTRLPPSVEVDSGSERKVLQALEMFEGKPVNAFYQLAQTRRWEEALAVAEWDLERTPGDKDMLEGYVESVGRTNDLPRMEAFLRAGLTNRPVNIEWHRAYQDLRMGLMEGEQLIPEYEAMLKGEPSNSALMYLCGRIVPDHARAEDLFTRARAADPDNPYPIFAVAHDQMSAGNWQAAKPLLDRALALQPGNDRFRGDWETACIALGQFDEAARSLQAQLKRNPVDLRAVLQLSDVLVAQGRKDEGQQVVTELVRAAQTRKLAGVAEIKEAAEEHYLYSVGDFKALEAAARQDKSPTGKASLFCALLEQDRVADACAIYSAREVADPMVLLSVTLAWHMAGRTNEALPWKKALLAALRAGGADSTRAADLLEGRIEPSPALLAEIALPAHYKAAMLADLAVTHPEQRAQLSQQARNLNINRLFPYHLIQRATAPAP